MTKIVEMTGVVEMMAGVVEMAEVVAMTEVVEMAAIRISVCDGMTVIFPCIRNDNGGRDGRGSRDDRGGRNDRGRGASFSAIRRVAGNLDNCLCWSAGIFALIEWKA